MAERSQRLFHTTAHHTILAILVCGQSADSAPFKAGLGHSCNGATGVVTSSVPASVGDSSKGKPILVA